jgi:ArsR family transcriptional regulator
METENLSINSNDNISPNEQQVQADVETASRSLKAMSHPLRLMILCKLGEDEFSVQDIVDNVGTSQSNISQHLAILRDKGILSARKSANKVFYKVSDIKTLKLIEMMREVFCSHQK